MSREPIRMADLIDGASSEEEFMRAIIRAERTELPTKAEMQQLSGRLGPLMANQSTFGSSASPWRWLLVAGLVAGLTAAVVSLRPSGGPSQAGGAPPAPQRAVEAPVTSPPAIAVTAPASAAPAPVVAVESLPTASATPRTRPASSTDVPTCSGEIELLDRADAALRSGDALRALDLTRKHSERCSSGAFVQERERIAIDALSRLGRGDEMRARARAFEDRYPSSPHLHRIRSLVEQHSE